VEGSRIWVLVGGGEEAVRFESGRGKEFRRSSGGEEACHDTAEICGEISGFIARCAEVLPESTT